MNGNDFSRSMRRRDSDKLLDQAEMWRLLGLFFDEGMPLQNPIAGAIDRCKPWANMPMSCA
jgi:hypothetical protein